MIDNMRIYTGKVNTVKNYLFNASRSLEKAKWDSIEGISYNDLCEAAAGSDLFRVPIHGRYRIHQSGVEQRDSFDSCVSKVWRLLTNA